MAAFIVAVRETVRQAVLLGLAATLLHTAVVWLVALGGMWLSSGLKAEDSEPYFQLASGVIIVGMAGWMLWRARGKRIEADRFHEAHSGQHHHHHHDDDHGHDHDHHEQSDQDIREKELATGGYVDAHEMAHAEDIRRRFTNREVTTGQIALFALSGDLIPCPGVITVLILCLQLQRVALGAVLVMSFSIGLALTMVEENRDALETTQQLQAVVSALEKAKTFLVTHHIEHHLEEAVMSEICERDEMYRTR